MYILVVVQTANDGTVTPAAFKYETLDAAKAAFYSELAAGYSSSAIATDACMVINQTCGIIKSDSVARNSSDNASTTAQG